MADSDQSEGQQTPQKDRNSPNGNNPKIENQGCDQDKDEKKEDPKAARRKKRLALLIGGPILLALIIIAVIYWLHARHYESTDDAFVDGHISQIASQVSGQVVKLEVSDNEEVKNGQPLFEIDPRDYVVKLTQAQAQLVSAQAQAAQARANVEMQEATVAEAQANVVTAEADANRTGLDLQRYKAVDQRAISRQQLDTANAAAKSNSAKLDASQQQVNGAVAQKEAAKAQADASDAAIKQSEADVAAAQLQLSYTSVKAPQDGRITRRTVEIGNYLTPGQPALAVVSDKVWITANFKETQLTHMKIGQKVDIQVDAYPDAQIEGHIDSLQSGTGSVFSALPAENATGNYVKIVQRVPVKILIDHIKHDDDHRVRLTPGLSVQPRVKVR